MLHRSRTRSRRLVPMLLVAVAAAASCSEDPAPVTGDDPDARPADAGSGPGDPVVDASAVAADASAGAADAAAATADAAVGAADAAIPDTACAPSAWAPGTSATIALRHGDRDRSYVVHVGQALAAGRPASLVLNFHGLDNSPAIQEAFSRMNRVADREGFIVVNPQGVESSFNGGGCCGPAADQDIDDVGFARAIVADVAARICVDRRRVYATGFSNGGYMSHRLGCEAADLFAAIAPVASANAVADCQPSRPVPVMAFHGLADTVVEPASGQRSVEAWAVRNGCPSPPTRTAYGRASCDRWTGCRSGTTVELCTVQGLWHLWPTSTSARPASPAIWEFFDGITLP